MLGAALSLTFRAAPVTASATVALQIVSAGSFGILLLLLDRILAEALAPAVPGTLVPRLWPAFAVLAAILTVAVSAQFLQNALRVLVVERVTWRATQHLLDVATAADQALFDTPAFHDRLTRAQSAVSRPAMTTDGLFGVIGGMSSTIGLATVVAAHEPVLLLLVLVVVTPLLFANGGAARRLHGAHTDLSESNRRRSYLASLMTSRVTSTEVRAYGLAGFLRSRERSLFDERIRRLTRAIAPSAVLTTLSGMLASLGLVTGLVLIVARVADGTLGPSSASLVGVGLLQLNFALATLLAGVSRLYENSLFLDDLRAFREHLARTGFRPTEPAPSTIDTVTVEDVTFRYPGTTRPVLREVSLSLRRGELVALVGGNGSGKTTLAKLLGNLYQPETGTILWDGHDLSGIDPESARSRIAVLHQDFTRYLMTVAENIGLGEVDRLPDQEAVHAAARRAGASEFVDRLPDGVATGLGSVFAGSVDLSGGQWQRLALSRALFRDAPLLILDEPTAALDASAEREFFRTLRDLATDRIVVLISHRMTGVRSADRIHVLDGGRIVETGTHDELTARDGRYAELARSHAATSTGEPVTPDGTGPGTRAATASRRR